MQVRTRLPRPATYAYPHAFYERVARIYTALVAKDDRAPCKTIAEANGYPASAVHRWVATARDLNLLPPGHQGRAG